MAAFTCARGARAAQGRGAVGNGVLAQESADRRLNPSPKLVRANPRQPLKTLNIKLGTLE